MTKSIESSGDVGRVDRFRPDPRFQARVDAGRAQADAGRLAEAEVMFQRLLDEVRGEHAANETYVLGSLMTIYARGGRAFEALVLARHLEERLRAGGDVRRAAGCLATYCETLLAMRAFEALASAVRELGALVTRLPDGLGVMPRECLALCSALLAVEDGDVAAARRHAAAYGALDPQGEERAWRKPYVSAMIGVDIDLADGQAERAVEALERVAALDIPEAGVALDIGRARIRVFDALDAAGPAMVEARELLGRLQALQVEPFLAPERVRAGAWLGAWFADKAGCEAEAREAYDLAAAAVILRIAQLDAAVRTLPELGLGTIRQSRDLIALRRAFVREQAALLRRVGRFLRESETALALLHDGGRAGLVRLCAWCERVCSEGTWLPIGHFVPRTQALSITHSICPACASELRGDDAGDGLSAG